MPHAAAPLLPVILSGGSGTRLWPLSRELYPKQMVPMWEGQSTLQMTAERCQQAQMLPPLVVCNHEHRFIVAEQLRQSGIQPCAIILEPCARNTAAAVAVATAYALEHYGDAAQVLILPADHLIANAQAFAQAVATATQAAQAGYITTFGIQPDHAETGYGYIQRGEALTGVEGAYCVQRFVEKPDAPTAEAYVRDGGYAWNSGMFLFPASTMQQELQTHVPAIAKAAHAALAAAKKDLEFCRLDEVAFAASPSDSIDYAVMEKTKHAAVVPCDIGWRDVGSWLATWEASPKDAAGNAAIGQALLHESSNCYVYSPKQLVGVIGLENVAVVATDDAILVLNMQQSQQVKGLLAKLPPEHASKSQNHRKVYRPWGYYDSIYEGPRAQVKEITVKPGEKLSLQKHFHRSEHWVVVNGTALVTRDEEQLLIGENESVFIPLGAVHRLENPGKVPLRLIEVQSGEYLGEDDIVRLQDTYNRV